jgi:hypothetical protein
MANDTFELTSKLVKGAQRKEAQARQNDMKIYQENTLTTAISPLYARYVGDTVTIAFNGNFKKFPVDGKQFQISKGHYNALMKYLHHIDRQIKIQKTNQKFMDQNLQGDFKKI